MWIRGELKERAKIVLRSCFWAAVVVCLISGLLGDEFGGRGNSGSKRTESEQMEIQFGNAPDVVKRISVGAIDLITEGLSTVFVILGLVVFIIALFVTLFVGLPIVVGSKRFFMCSRERKVGIGEIFYGFRSGNVLHIIWIQFLVKVKTLLWSLLLIIPGIIKGYEYMMVPYILAENPSISTERAFSLSKEMMDENKWDAFVLDISFVLWYLLGAFTCGLAGVFFVNPYMAATKAELYSVLRENMLRDGTTNTYELPGFGEEENHG